MKLLATILGAAALYGGVQVFHDGQPAPADAAANSSDSYRLASNGGAACTIERGAALSNGLSRLTVSPGCHAVLPGIERAKFWRDRKDGSVGFSENGTDPIVSFAVGDGVEYESYAPAMPILTLASVE